MQRTGKGTTLHEDVGAGDPFVLRPIDRRSGLPMRSNGAPLTICTRPRRPDEFAAEALARRAGEVRAERLVTRSGDWTK